MIKNTFKGMTIIEMLVAITIFVIAIEGFTLLFVKSWKINAYSFEMGQSSFTVSRGLDRMVSLLRKVRQADDGSYPIKLAQDNELTVFCDFDNDGITERLHFYFQDGKIIMGSTKPANTVPKTYPNEDQATEIIAANIVNDSSVPVFYYYNKNYPGDQTGNPVPTPASVSDIRLIKIFLKININPNRAPDNIEMQSFAELRNLNDYDRLK